MRQCGRSEAFGGVRADRSEERTEASLVDPALRFKRTVNDCLAHRLVGEGLAPPERRPRLLGRLVMPPAAIFSCLSKKIWKKKDIGGDKLLLF